MTTLHKKCQTVHKHPLVSLFLSLSDGNTQKLHCRSHILLVRRQLPPCHSLAFMSTGICVDGIRPSFLSMLVTCLLTVSNVLKRTYIRHVENGNYDDVSNEIVDTCWLLPMYTTWGGLQSVTAYESDNGHDGASKGAVRLSLCSSSCNMEKSHTVVRQWDETHNL